MSNLVYTEHNIECWVERQIDILDCKYQLDQISTEDYNKKMEEIEKQAERLYALAYQYDLESDEVYVYELWSFYLFILLSGIIFKTNQMKIHNSTLRAVIERVTELEYDNEMLYVFENLDKQGRPAKFWIQNWECDDITDQFNYNQQSQIAIALRDYYRSEAVPER